MLLSFCINSLLRLCFVEETGTPDAYPFSPDARKNKMTL